MFNTWPFQLSTDLLGRDDEAFVEQPVLDQEQLLDVVLCPKAMASQASHLQQNVNVLEHEKDG